VELQALRDEVQQLQEQLRTLQDRQTDESRHRRVRQRQYIEIAWKLAAEREQAQMEAAVAENARLKTLVDRHLELSRVLQPTLFQDGSTDLPRQARLQTAVERATLFASMELKLTARLPNIKAVARRAALAASAPADSHSMNVIDTTSSHPLGSLQQCRTFPFGVDAVMDAKWGCAQRGFPDVAARTHSVRNKCVNLRERGKDTNRCVMRCLQAEMLSEDALGIDILVDLPPEHPVSGRVSLHLRGVLKRWTTSVGSIVQFAGMSEWHTDSSAATWVTEEFSWSVIRALGSARSSHMQRTTESTFVSLGASPEAAPSVDSSLTASREAMETVVLPCIQHVTDRVDQATENALLDVARRG